MAASKPKSKPRKTRSKRVRPLAAIPADFEDDDLTPAQRRELERRVADLNDRTRYLLVSTLGPNFVLYYNASEDTYGWNDPSHATLFKRRKAAEAIARLIGGRDGVVRCQVEKHGRLLKRSIELPSPSVEPPRTRATAGARKRGVKTKGSRRVSGRG